MSKEQWIRVECYKSNAIELEVKHRLLNLGYKDNETNITETFCKETGGYSRFRGENYEETTITVDEFFKMKDEDLRPIWIKVSHVKIGEKILVMDHDSEGNYRDFTLIKVRHDFSMDGILFYCSERNKLFKIPSSDTRKRLA